MQATHVPHSQHKYSLQNSQHFTNFILTISLVIIVHHPLKRKFLLQFQKCEVVISLCNCPFSQRIRLVKPNTSSNMCLRNTCCGFYMQLSDAYHLHFYDWLKSVRKKDKLWWYTYSIVEEEVDLNFLYCCSITWKCDFSFEFLVFIILLLINHTAFYNRIYLLVAQPVIYIRNTAVALCTGWRFHKQN